MPAARRSQRKAKATDNRSRLQVDRSKTIAPKGRGKPITGGKAAIKKTGQAIGKAVSKVAGKLDPRKKDFFTILPPAVGPAGRAIAKAIGARSKARARAKKSSVAGRGRSRLRVSGR
jgi:hypothetical protein